MNHHRNIVRIKAVYNSLADLRDKVVFVGGATISLYPDRATLDPRPTADIDIIVEILNYDDRTRLEEKLRASGFTHDVESGKICRYRIHGIIVDIMPTTPESIGFSNLWYPEGFRNSVAFKIDDKVSVRILSVPYFIATKLEAFKGRGKGDGRTSHDFEDIVYILENRDSVWMELAQTTGCIKEYLRHEFQKLRANPYIFEWIDCHVEYGSPPASYFILDQIDKFLR